ncbi:MAG: Dam family site-specific DNA-(adenine-N6)-methyltransferase, partial [Candidatus Cloacimonetes bacterium]|nr:Dam family site-specific DNA-(adenine-N6)-methyltransferase [Candidatus Cloacimonadota bacterium]
ELVCAYKCFLDEKLFIQLKEELRKHEANHSEAYYYEVRKQDQIPDFLALPVPIRAARMIYLNKACFNGLYRVNSKGFFNVPFGKKERVNTFEDDNFTAIKKYFLNNDISLTNQDFEKTVENAKAGDFVYFDPPYDVYPNKLGFVDYGKDGFGKEEQIRLRDCFKSLSDRGVKVMLSNHNTPFINEIYKGFNIHVIDAKRMINSKADGRGNVQEVIITNY